MGNYFFSLQSDVFQTVTGFIGGGFSLNCCDWDQTDGHDDSGALICTAGEIDGISQPSDGAWTDVLSVMVLYI